MISFPNLEVVAASAKQWHTAWHADPFGAE
jgi:hypothetical protein